MRRHLRHLGHLRLLHLAVVAMAMLRMIHRLTGRGTARNGGNGTIPMLVRYRLLRPRLHGGQEVQKYLRRGVERGKVGLGRDGRKYYGRICR